jgi:hypothetical protein
MTTYEILAEQVILLESGGDQSRDSELEKEDIILLLKQVSANFVRGEMYSGEMYSDYVSGESHPSQHFIWTDKLTLSKKSKGVYTATLPSVPFSLPDDRGVHSVTPAGDYNDQVNDHPFMYVPNGATTFVKDALVGEVGYTVERKTLTVFNLCNPVKEVNVQLVLVNPESIGESDEIYLPFEHQQLIVSQVLDIVKGRSVLDVVNDSKDVR